MSGPHAKGRLASGPLLYGFLPLIGGLSVIAIALAVFRFANPLPLEPGLFPAIASVGPDAIAREWRNRFLWEATVVLLLVACAVAAVIASAVILRFQPARDRRWLMAGAWSSAAAAAFFISFSDVSLEFARPGLLEPSLGVLARQSRAALTLDDFQMLRRAINILSVAAAVLTVFAMMACTTLSADRTGTATEDGARALRDRSQALGIVLYAATGVLAGIVLYMVAWLHWPGALVDPGPPWPACAS